MPTFPFHKDYDDKFPGQPIPEVGADAHVTGPRLAEVNSSLAKYEDALMSLQDLLTDMHKGASLGQYERAEHVRGKLAEIEGAATKALRVIEEVL